MLTVLSPVGVPGVGNDPIGCAIFDAPANHFDSVAATELAGLVLVDTATIGKKIFIYFERHFHRAVGHDLFLNRFFVIRDAIRRSACLIYAI